MDDDEDDFFAHQTAKSLNNKRTQLKRFFQAPISTKAISSSSESDSENATELICNKKSKPLAISLPVQSIVIDREPIKSKDTIQNEINAIVTSCFTKSNKEVKRKIKLGKRTAADDREYEQEDEYVTQLVHGNGRMNRMMIDAMNRSQLEEDDEKVTRETAAYDRLEAVLRVTKPLCENRNDSTDEENNDEPNESDLSNDIDSITFKIDHSDGRQITLVLPSSTTFKELYQQVSERLSLPSIYLVHNNQTLKLDDDNHFLTLKQFKFSTNHTEILESYPLTKKFERR